MKHASLDKFGEFLMNNLRDRVICYYDKLAAGEWKAPAVQTLQHDIASLTLEELNIVRRSIIRSLDFGIHQFLSALQENSDLNDTIRLIVEDNNIAKLSDGLQGELFTENGWMAKYSKYGEPAEEA